jgi:hypothetical protein
MHRHVGLIAGAALGLGPALAAAQGVCPGPADVSAGVWLNFPDRVVMMRVGADGLVEEWEFDAGSAAVYAYVSHPIGLLVESWVMEHGRTLPASPETYRHLGTPATIPAPAAGARFDGLEIITAADGAEVERSSLSLVVGEAGPITIGGCAYTGLPVTITRVDLQADQIERDSLIHLAELGLTLFLGLSVGADPLADVLPDTITARAPVAQDLSLLPPPAPPPAEPGK